MEPTAEALHRLGLPEQVRGCLFDVDGVLTRTASVHRAAWRDVFDPVLHQHGLAPFTDADYRDHVDGKPRAAGIRDLLRARGITPGPDLVRSIGTAKNDRFLRRLATDGPAPFASALPYLAAVRAAGLRTAAVTSSTNGAAVLAGAGLRDEVDVLIDGLVAAERGLAGKPAPDTFLAAAAELGLSPDRAAVFEDALAGVAAGQAGGFALVVGIDHAGHPDRLRAAGADVVVTDLAELVVDP